MLREVTGASIPLQPRQLEAMLIARRDARARQDYALHLLWLTGLELFTLSGGRDYPVPSPSAAFMPAQDDSSTAAEIRQRLLQRLMEERSDP